MMTHLGFDLFVAVSASVQLATEVDLQATAVDNDVIRLALDEDSKRPLVSNLTLVNSFQIRNRLVSPVSGVSTKVSKKLLKTIESF